MSPGAVDTLASVPLLSGLSQRDLKALAQSMREHTFTAGRDVVVQGKGGIGFFVIADGRAAVTVGGEVVRMLGPGDYFGETALLDGDARTATVTADTDLRCVTMTAWHFKPFVLEHPEVAWAMLETFAKRMREVEAR